MDEKTHERNLFLLLIYKTESKTSNNAIFRKTYTDTDLRDIEKMLSAIIFFSKPFLRK